MAHVDGAGGDEERLVGGYSGRLLLSLSSAYLVIQFGRNILSPLLSAIIGDLGISSFEAGIALSVIGAGYAFSMYPGGRLSDQLSRKTVLVTAGLVAALGFGILAGTVSYGQLLAGAGIMGIGAGLFWISLRALLADLFVERRGVAFGIQDSLGFTGPMLAAGGAILVLAVTSWQVVFLPVIALLLVAVLLAHRWIREPYVLESVDLDLLATGNRVFADPAVRPILIGYTSGIFAMQGLIGFLPLFLQVEQGFSETASSLGFGVLFLGAMVTMPIAGFLGDRFTYVPVAISGLGLSVLALIGLVFGNSWVVVVASVFCFGFGIWAFPPVIQAHLMTHFPSDSMGGDYGAFKTVYSGVGSLGPTYIGFVAGQLNYSIAFLGLTVFIVIAIGLFARL